jgi:hypothetical protein
MIMEPSEPMETSLTALNFFLRAHAFCGLKTGPTGLTSGIVLSELELAENVKISPLEDKAANISSQHVILTMCASLIDCGGR